MQIVLPLKVIYLCIKINVKDETYKKGKQKGSKLLNPLTIILCLN